jgi:hypothetical protein
MAVRVRNEDSVTLRLKSPDTKPRPGCLKNTPATETTIPHAPMAISDIESQHPISEDDDTFYRDNRSHESLDDERSVFDDVAD